MARAISERSMRPLTVRRPARFATHRVDAWWLGPAANAVGLVALFGYLTLRAFDATYVWFDPYISPTVAPPLFTPTTGYAGAVPLEHSWFGAFPAWWPAFLPQSPAFFMPALAIAFRFTCYYYRGAYYRSLFATPPACGVRGVRWQYRGETVLLVVQNLHRYTLYGALILLVCLWTEGLSAFFRQGRFGIGIGTVIMVVNASLLTCYALGCHAWRHLIGGRLDCFNCDAAGTARYGMWHISSWFNARHMGFAWASLLWVVFTDAYIFLISSGRLDDVNTW